MGASVPVIWDWLGYRFQAGPLIVAICATAITRLIVSLNTEGRRRMLLDAAVTMLSILLAALWVQANDLALLPAGIPGIGCGALAVSIISLVKSQTDAASWAGLRTFMSGLGAPPPKDIPDDQAALLRQFDSEP